MKSKTNGVSQTAIELTGASTLRELTAHRENGVLPDSRTVVFGVAEGEVKSDVGITITVPQKVDLGTVDYRGVYDLDVVVVTDGDSAERGVDLVDRVMSCYPSQIEIVDVDTGRWIHVVTYGEVKIIEVPSGGHIQRVTQ